MTGKKGRSGRRPGSISYPNNPTALAGHHLKVLIEMWLAMQPERRFTVPPKIMRVLAQFAIRHVLNVYADLDAVWHVEVDDVLAWARRRAPDNTLRRKARPSYCKS
jgi:hypothetical protein